MERGDSRGKNSSVEYYYGDKEVGSLDDLEKKLK